MHILNHERYSKCLPSLNKSAYTAVLMAKIVCQTDTAIHVLMAKFIGQQRGPEFQLSVNQRNHL